MKRISLPSLSCFSGGNLRPLLLLAVGVLFLVVGSSVWSGLSAMEVRSRLQQRRLQELLQVIKSYKSLPGKEDRAAPSEDPIVVVSSLVDSMGLKDNLVQLSSLSKGLSVQLSRLYTGKALDFLRELEKRGLSVDSGELRAVPDGGERRLSMSLIVVVAP
ncbi:MAG: hypothetical protein CSA35_04385 [Dethiosulfovibrio peptidovorans]|nr:MAG: hypothetical protein CSA35_04385 [Dethiosulfovibrio peptidovorans]